MNSPVTRQILAAAIAVALFACGGGSGSAPAPYDGPMTIPHDGPGLDPGDGTGGGGGVLQTQRDVWDAQGITDYRITVERMAFTPPELAQPVVVEVRGGQVVSRTYEATGLPVNPATASWWPDVPGLFQIVEDHIAGGSVQVDVIYDPTFGHPTSIVIDVHLGMADDGQGIRTWSLTLL